MHGVSHVPRMDAGLKFNALGRKDPRGLTCEVPILSPTTKIYQLQPKEAQEYVWWTLVHLRATMIIED